MPSTTAPASAPLIKNRATRTIASTDMVAASENSFRVSKSELAGLSAGSWRGSSPGEVQVDGRSPENGEPDETHQARNQQYAEDELPYRPAFGDTGDEHTHERGPGELPGLVEEGVGSQPLLVTGGGHPEAHRDEVADVSAERLGEGV